MQDADRQDKKSKHKLMLCVCVTSRWFQYGGLCSVERWSYDCEWWIVKDLKGSGCDLINPVSRNLLSLRQNHITSHSIQAVFHPRLEVVIFRIQAKSVTARRGYSVKVCSLEDVSEEYVSSIFWVEDWASRRNIERHVRAWVIKEPIGSCGDEKSCFLSAEATREKQRPAGEK
jgi:hypothetical protein